MTSFEVEPIAWVEASRERAEDDYWGAEASCIVLSGRIRCRASRISRELMSRYWERKP